MPRAQKTILTFCLTALVVLVTATLGAVEEGWMHPATAAGDWLWPERAVDTGPRHRRTFALDLGFWSGGPWLTATTAHPLAADGVSVLGRFHNCRRLVVQVADAAGEWETVYRGRPRRRPGRGRPLVIGFERRVVTGVRLRARYRWWHGGAFVRDLQLHRRDRAPTVELTAPTGGVHAGRVGHTDIALCYREHSTPIVGDYDRRPLLADIPGSSLVSPVRFTGRRWGPDHAVSSTPGTVDQVGTRLFHATVPLDPADVTPVTLRQTVAPPPGTPVSAETTTRTGAITWTCLDLFQDHDPVTVLAGDALLLTLESGSGGDTTPVTIDVDGDGVPECEGLPGERLPCPLTTPGTWQVQACYDGETAIDGTPIPPLSVTVVEARLPRPIACEIGYARSLDIDCGTLDPTAVLARPADPAALAVTPLAVAGRTQRITLEPAGPGTPVLELRGPGDVLLDAVEIDVFDLRDENAAVIPVVDYFPDGTLLVEATISQTPHVPYLDCRFEIFVSHLSFADGTLITQVPTADFTPRPDGSAAYPLQMIMSPTCTAGACHTQTVYQDGIRVSR